MKHIYPAIFREEDGFFYVNFPDVQGCFTDGRSLTEAMDNAQDVLNLMLCHLESDGLSAPQPTAIKEIATGSNEFTTLIEADTIAYQAFYSNKAIKKTLSIPTYLNTIAERENINFSQVLQEALKQKLNIG